MPRATAPIHPDRDLSNPKSEASRLSLFACSCLCPQRIWSEVSIYAPLAYEPNATHCGTPLHVNRCQYAVECEPSDLRDEGRMTNNAAREPAEDRRSHGHMRTDVRMRKCGYVLMIIDATLSKCAHTCAHAPAPAQFRAASPTQRCRSAQRQTHAMGYARTSGPAGACAVYVCIHAWAHWRTCA